MTAFLRRETGDFGDSGVSVSTLTSDSALFGATVALLGDCLSAFPPGAEGAMRIAFRPFPVSFFLNEYQECNSLSY